jgi:8-oxo-dGTP pyrophosphatase MutT (NUDIX family)
MEPNKTAYLSPATGLLDVTVVRDAHPTVTLALDLGIPNFTVFSLKFPFAEDDERTMSGLVAEGVHVLLDEVSAFMLSVGYEEDTIVQLYATILACYRNLTLEADSDKAGTPAGRDGSIKTFEGTFKLPMAFINQTQQKVVTAAVNVKRIPQVRKIELHHEKPPKVTTGEAARVIRQFRNRSLKSQPSPMYIIVYDQMGRGQGTIPLGHNFKNQLLNMMYKKGSEEEFEVQASLSKTALNIPRLLQDFGKKLEARYTQEFGENSVYEDAASPHSAEDLIKWVASQDPSPNKQYTAWIVGNYTRGDIQRWEDIKSRTVPALKRYHALKKGNKLQPEDKDIGRVKGLSQLEDIIEKYAEVDTTSKRQQEVSREQQFFDAKEAVLIYNDANVKVVSPKTEETSKYFGVNTRWCTAAESGNMFNYYNRQGPLYIVLFKAENKRFQFHFETAQYMDELDHGVNTIELVRQYPILKKIFSGIAEKAITSQYNRATMNALAFIENPSEELKMKAVQYDPATIRMFPNPSEALMEQAVSSRGSVLEYIDNPTEKVMQLACENDGEAIQFIEDPTIEMQTAAVDSTYRALEFIENPPEEIKTRAFYNHLGKKPEDFNQQLGGFIVEKWDNLEDFVESRGDSVAKYIMKTLEDGGDFYIETYDDRQNMEEALEACKPETLKGVVDYLKFNHADELADWLRDYRDEVDGVDYEDDAALAAYVQQMDMDESDIADFLEDMDVEEPKRQVLWGWQTGQETGAQNEMLEALKDTFNGFETGYGTTIVMLKPDSFWDSPIVEVCDMETAQTAVREYPDDDNALEYYKDGEGFEFKVTEPYNGWSGWDASACNDRISEELFVSEDDIAQREAEKQQAQPVQASKTAAAAHCRETVCDNCGNITKCRCASFIPHTAGCDHQDVCIRCASLGEPQDNSPEGAASRGEVLTNGYGEKCYPGDPNYPMSEQEAAEENRERTKRVKQEQKTAAKATLRFPALKRVLTQDAYGFTHDNLDYAEKKEAYDELVKTFSEWKWPKAIYRSIELSDLDFLETKGFGTCWSYDESGAVSYGQMGMGDLYVFKGVIMPNAVDWATTFSLNLAQGEQEIRLKPGARVQLVSYRKGAYGGWRKPPQKYVTASMKTAKDAMRCSECGRGMTYDEFERLKLESCPECGAQMYWAGSGSGASGILPICSSTGRICLAWRSADVHEGNCWGTIGGAVQEGLSPEESAKEEMSEEMGYTGGIELHPAYVFKSGDFTYRNYIGVVANEFKFRPRRGHSWETDKIEWMTYDEILSEMKGNPGRYHSGLVKLFQQSNDLIREICSAASNKSTGEESN